ncbi:MAG TPA: response regulator [Candidatus Sulfopaludibacter sp.]|jgi:CheY-like chemotaxis protein|nr:response regulator [Candidatus Sulfopaludibacter sp.]
MAKKRICFVDDEPDIILLCKIVLEEGGFEVYTFTDSLVALTNFKPGFYDLIILDIKMPNMDGFELYRKIKEKDQNTKVCFLTASEMYYETFRKNGFGLVDKDLFLRKPIENDELIKKVNQIIGT